MKLPNKVKVAHLDIKIQEYDMHRANSDNNWGRYSGQECLIEIDMTANENKIIEVFIHEITHAIYKIYNIEDEDKEERIVTIMAVGWAQVYRDNPEILEFIRG